MSLYDDVLEEAKKSLGGTADVFIDRQIKIHLKVDPPQSLAAVNIKDLAVWAGRSASLLIDREKADELKANILGLG